MSESIKLASYVLSQEREQSILQGYIERINSGVKNPRPIEEHRLMIFHADIENAKE